MKKIPIIYLFIFLLQTNATETRYWRDSEIINVLKYGALDISLNYCSKSQALSCHDLITKFKKFNNQIYNLENKTYNQLISNKNQRKLVMGYIDEVIKIIDEISLFLVTKLKSHSDMDTILEQLNKKIHLVRKYIFIFKKNQMKQEFLPKDSISYLFGNPDPALLPGSQEFHKALVNVIKAPTPFTVRKIVDTAMAVYNKQSKSDKKDYFFNNATDLTNRYRSLYDEGLTSWDQACWICGRIYYFNTVHRMMEFAILFGGVNNHRFAAAEIFD